MNSYFNPHFSAFILFHKIYTMSVNFDCKIQIECVYNVLASFSNTVSIYPCVLLLIKTNIKIHCIFSLFLLCVFNLKK